MSTRSLVALGCAFGFNSLAYAGPGIVISAGMHTKSNAEIAALVIDNPAMDGLSAAQVSLQTADADSEMLTLNAPGGRQIQLRRTASSHAENGLLVWRGSVTDPTGNRARGTGLFVFGPDVATGYIQSQGHEWRLLPQSDGGHLLMEIDSKRLQSAGVGDLADSRAVPQFDADRAAAEPATVKVGDKAMTTVDILVAVDANLIPNYPAAQARAQLEVESANVALGDSMTNVRLRLVGTLVLTDTPAVDPAQQLLALASPADGVMDTVHAMRNGVGADIVVLLSKSSGGICGIAQSLMPTAAEAFAVVRGNSGCDNTLFAHEVAHLFSAEHDPPNAGWSVPPSTKAYARGFVRNYTGKLTNESYATIMTYNDGDTCVVAGQPSICVRQNAYSNPRRLDEYGYPMGTVSTYDNARAIAEEAPRIAAFRSEQTASNPYPIAGSWYNPGRAGNGLSLTRARVTNGGLVLTWYTYNADGSTVWYASGVAQVVNGVWSSDLYKVRRNSNGSVTRTLVGDAQIKFFSGTNGVFSWDFHDNGNSSGFDGSEYVQHLFGGAALTGQWYAPAESGWGIIADQQGSLTISTVMYFQGAEPVWVQSIGISGNPTLRQAYNMRRYIGLGLCPSCQGQTIVRSNVSAGTIDLSLADSSGQINTAILSADGSSWIRGSLANPVSLSRLTGP